MLVRYNGYKYRQSGVGEQAVKFGKNVLLNTRSVDLQLKSMTY